MGPSTAGDHRASPYQSDGKYESGFYASRSKLIEDAAEYGGRAMYWTVNQVDGSLADRVTNEIAPAQKGACTHSKHIARIINIVFDCDAVRPIGWPATDEEHAATLEVAYKIRAYLAALGFPEPAVFDSGNGTYLIYKTDLSPELKPLVRAFVEYVSKQFSNEKVFVDNSVWKLPQLLRIPGTWNRKKQATAERPHRRRVDYQHPRETGACNGGHVVGGCAGAGGERNRGGDGDHRPDG